MKPCTALHCNGATAALLKAKCMYYFGFDLPQSLII